MAAVTPAAVAVRVKTKRMNAALVVTAVATLRPTMFALSVGP